jgi:hypothetical protein
MSLLKQIIICITPLLVGGCIYISDSPPVIIRNYLPDFCWSFSLFITQYIFGSFDQQKSKIYISSAVLGLCYELGQKLGYWPGTFDFIDIVVYQFGLLISILTYKYLFSKDITRE